MLGGSFSLVDHHGRHVTDATFHGRHALLFFGFTHCKVVCPATLSRISAALDNLGPVAELIQPLYISVDPARDSPPVLKQFLEKRFPRFLGLTGDKASIDDIKRAYKVYAQQQVVDEDGNYDVPHTAMIFIVGPTGEYITHFGDAETSDDIENGLRRLLEDQ